MAVGSRSATVFCRFRTKAAFELPACARRQRGASLSSWAAQAAALAVLSDVAAAPRSSLEASVHRHAQARRLTPSERGDASDLVLAVARHQGRIDWRLQRAGFPTSPENRLAAASALGVTARPAAHRRGRNLHRAKSDPSFRVRLGPGPLETDAMDRRVRLECPEWAWRPMLAAFGDVGAESELRALQRPAPLDLRVNTLKVIGREAEGGARQAMIREMHAAGLDCAPTEWSPLGIRLRDRVDLRTVPGLLEGYVEPMNEGSQLVAALVGATPGEAVVDYCAGSGGKTLALAAQMSNRGRLWALDVHAGRLAAAKRRLARGGVGNAQRRLLADGADPWSKRRKGTFDAVLVDAPCSCVGTWRRRPATRYAPQRVDLVALQGEVLERAARLARPGGRLVYATCTLLPEENERQVQRFLDSAAGADWIHVTTEAATKLAVPVDEDGFLRLTPGRHGTDGFFAAMLRRRL